MRVRTLLLMLLLLGILPLAVRSQVLETEESTPLLPGQFAIGTGLEFQTSKEGTETALPLAIEYGLSKKLTVLCEPVGFTSIRPKQGLTAKGIGDVELTLFYQVVSQIRYLPSISFAAEVKIPTARNSLIGTGKMDFTPYLIMSKKMGRFFTSINLSYTFLGQPEGTDAANLFNYAAGTIFTLSKKSILYGELYGNTSAFGGAENGEAIVTTNTKTSEITGQELVTAMGYGYYLNKTLLISFGINYDNNHALLFRPGIEWKFGGKKK